MQWAAVKTYLADKSVPPQMILGRLGSQRRFLAITTIHGYSSSAASPPPTISGLASSLAFAWEIAISIAGFPVTPHPAKSIVYVN